MMKLLAEYWIINKSTYELGFELNSVGWYEICAFSYLATFGSVSSAFNIGRVLLKNSNVSRFNKSLKLKKTAEDILSSWNGNKTCNKALLSTQNYFQILLTKDMKHPQLFGQWGSMEDILCLDLHISYLMFVRWHLDHWFLRENKYHIHQKCYLLNSKNW